jgi:hypothetical protein
MRVTLRIVQCGILLSIVMYLAWEEFVGPAGKPFNSATKG